MKNKKIVVICLSLAMLFSFVIIVVEMPIPVKAGTIWVDDSFPSEDATHKWTIQAGVDNATPGDTVYVYAGIYYEDVVIDKTLNLIGEDRDSTIINATYIGISIANIDYVNISGFTIENGSDYGIAISNSDSCLIFNNNISNNDNGMHLFFSNKNSIIGNHLTFNHPRAISFESSSENNISNNNVTNNWYGIYLSSSSSKNNITFNNITYNEAGIYVWGSYNTNFTNNSFINDGIFVGGTQLSHYTTHIIPDNNKVNNRPIYYYKDSNNFDLNNIPVGQIILINCTNVNLTNLDINNTDCGIEVVYSKNINITNNNISLNDRNAIYLRESLYNTIENNNCSLSEWCIELNSNSNNNTLINNNVTSNYVGISFDTSFDNYISGNNVSTNEWGGIRIMKSTNNNITNNFVLSNTWNGIRVYDSTNNYIINNTIFSNSDYGIALWGSSGNYIYHNSFIDNTNQALDEHSNYWDNGYPSGGNYWSNYIGVDNFKGPNQDIPGSDGIGDVNYTIDTNSKDNYPLMAPYKPLKNYTVLKQGWNLISIPLIQEKTDLTKVLEMIDGYYDAVQWYNLTDGNDPWKHYKVGKPFGIDLYELNESIGFWIHITQPGDTIFIYNGTQPTVNQNILLIPGWNLVGYPSLNDKNRTDALNNIDFGTDVDAIWTHNATTQKWKEITASDNFEVGRGYWIHSKVTKTWIVPL